jgi:hypothetical protein
MLVFQWMIRLFPGRRKVTSKLHFKSLEIPDPLKGNKLCRAGSDGSMAGVVARMDEGIGIWKALAGRKAVFQLKKLT